MTETSSVGERTKSAPWSMAARAEGAEVWTLEGLQEEAQAASVIESNKERAYAYLEKVTKAMQALRTPADKLEMLVDRELWPLPSYGDMVFEV